MSVVNEVGCAESVVYKKGLFSQSLKQFKEPISVIFLDTDLYDSSFSALTALTACFSRDTTYFSDGVSGKRDFSGGNFRPHHNEAKAVEDYFRQENIRTDASWTGNGNMGVFRNVNSLSKINFSTGFVSYLAMAFYFPQRFHDHIYVKGRADNQGVIFDSDITEAKIYDYCASELIQHSFASAYYIGHLEWMNNKLRSKN
jgi:hypothetical protein